MGKKEKILKVKKEVVKDSINEVEKKKEKENLVKKNKKRKRIEIAFDFVIAGILVYALVFYIIYSKNLTNYLLPALVGVMFYFTAIFFSFTLHQMCKDLSMKKKKIIYLIIYFLVMIILTPITIFSLLAGYFLSDDDFFEKLNIRFQKRD
jgi:F0F1-type ATP synthase assembly protein I